MKSLRISRISLISVFLYIILAMAALCDSNSAHIVGVLALFIVLFSCNLRDSIVLVAVFTPNLALITLSNDGIGLLGLMYCVMFLKILFVRKTIISIKIEYIIPFILLLLVAFIRVFYGNTYDFLILFEVFIVIFTWDSVLDVINERFYHSIYNGFALGCVLMLIGMIMNQCFSDVKASRLTAILDDPNFCSISFLILFSCSIIALAYKINVRNIVFNIVISLIGGFLTGSRGFLVSLGVVILLLLVVGVTNKEVRKVVLYFCLLIAIVFLLYLLEVRSVVELYNNTIGRTLDLRDSYVQGTFMDVSSGRLFLWDYYLKYLINNPRVLLFGRGFHDYYLSANGGYHNMSAHNSYIESLIGIGLMGTIMLIISYFSIWKRRLSIKNRKTFVFSIILIGVATSLFFLDGMLDLRFIMAFVMTLVMYKMYVDNNKSNTIWS